MTYINAQDLIQRPTLRASEVAELLDISISHVYESVKRGDIASVSIGRRKVIPARPILEMLHLRDTDPPKTDEAYGE